MLMEKNLYYPMELGDEIIQKIGNIDKVEALGITIFFYLLAAELSSKIKLSNLHIICSIFVAKHEINDMQPPRNRNMITKARFVKTDFRVPR